MTKNNDTLLSKYNHNLTKIRNGMNNKVKHQIIKYALIQKNHLDIDLEYDFLLF